jgi:hypothetical protein
MMEIDGQTRLVARVRFSWLLVVVWTGCIAGSLLFGHFRGGVSVSVPTASLRAIEKPMTAHLVLAHLVALQADSFVPPWRSPAPKAQIPSTKSQTNSNHQNTKDRNAEPWAVRLGGTNVPVCPPGARFREKASTHDFQRHPAEGRMSRLEVLDLRF